MQGCLIGGHDKNIRHPQTVHCFNLRDALHALRRLQSVLWLLLLAATQHTPLSAEIITDGSLGVATTLTGPDYLIPATLGQQVGNNLFHSFSTFNLNKAESATFSGADTVTNLITRVTQYESSLDGAIISEMPAANFYLINPAGIVFGPNIRFDVNGTLHITTASTLYLGEAGKFNSIDLNDTLLTSSPPSAFGFLNTTANSLDFDLEIDRSRLGTAEGNSLSLISSNILIKESELSTTAGRIDLVAVPTAERVERVREGWNFSTDVQLGDIELIDSTIDAGKVGSGDIHIVAGNLILQDSEIINNAVIDDGGQLKIMVNTLRLDNSTIRSRTLDTGDGSDFNINVAGDMTLFNSRISSESFDSGGGGDNAPNAGDAGNIMLNVGRLTMTDSTISTNTAGRGAGGDIQMTIAGALTLQTSANAAAATSTIQARSEGTVANAGDAGRININAQRLTMQGNSQIDDSTIGSGAAGSIDIDVCDTVSLTNGAAISSDSQGLGQAGSIRIRARSMDLLSARVSTATNQSNGGNIIMRIKSAVQLDSSEISATVSGGEGNGGNVFISNPPDIHLLDSKIIANASQGDGGLILIVTQPPFTSEGSELAASSETGVDGSVQIDFPVETNTLPIVFLDASSLIKQQCGVRSDEEVSSFFIYPSLRGLPHSPHDLQSHLPDLGHKK